MSDVNGVEEHESIDSYPKVRRRFGVEEHSLLFAKPDTVTSETRTRLYMHTIIRKHHDDDDDDDHYNNNLKHKTSRSLPFAKLLAKEMNTGQV